MPPLVETTTTPAEAVTHQNTDGEQPPIRQATPVAQQDEQTREEKARALLKGEPPKDAEPDLSEEASIDAHFDPETDELLETEPEAGPESGDRKPESSEAEADSPADETTGAGDSAEEDEEEPGEDRKARRIRIKRDALSDRDFAILTLAKDKKITFAEAEAHLFSNAAPTADNAAPQSGPAKQRTAREADAEIGALRTQREEARDALDGRRADQLTDQIDDLRDRLKEAHRFEATHIQATQQTATQRYAAAETAAIHRATEFYPDANTKGTKLHEAMQAKAVSLHAQDPGFFQNPKWPILLAVETATELGITARVKTTGDRGAETGKPPVKGSPALQVPVPKKTTRPAPTPAPGTATGAKTNTEAALREELRVATNSRDVEGIRAVMRKLTAAV